MIHSPRPTGLSRRNVLAAAGLAAAGAALAGCAPTSAPQPPDPLAALADRATADVRLATATAAAHPAMAATARLVADDRGQHAATLGAEVRRLHPVTTTLSSSVPPPPPSVPPTPDAAMSNLVSALRSAEQEAADLVPGLPRYRAGMVGSVAAGCAALVAVVA